MPQLELPLPDCEPEASQHLSRLQVWMCPNCGQHLFIGEDETLPELCDYCRDMTTWQRIRED